MKLWLAKATGQRSVGLVPTDKESDAAIRRLGDGECVEVVIVRPRSVQWNRLYWALCREIGQNQDPPRDEHSIDSELRILAGHYDVIRVGRARLPWWFGGLMQMLGRSTLGRWFAKRLRPIYEQHEVRVPKRIAFEKMTADEWSDYFQRVEVAIAERFGPEYVAELAA